MQSDIAPPVISVVVCDDHPTTARGIAKLLEIEAAEIKVVGIAFNGVEAVSMVRELSPDVVLMDLYMPGISGIEATSRIRTHSPETRVVMLTVSDLEVHLVEALRAGATGYVTKDQSLAEVVSAIRAVHGGQLTVPATMATRAFGDFGVGEGVSFSEEEAAILLSIAKGLTNRQIGEVVHLSERSVRRRVQSIYRKLGITDPRQAAAYASRASSQFASQAAVWSEAARRRAAGETKAADREQPPSA